MDGTEPSPVRLRRAIAAGDSPIAPATLRLAAFGVVGLGASAALRVLATRFDERMREALASPDTASAAAIFDVAWVAGPLLAVAAAAIAVTGLAQTGGVVRLFRDRQGPAGPAWRFRPWLSTAEPWAAAARAAVVLAGLAAATLLVLRAGAPAIAVTAGDAAGALHRALALLSGFFQVALAVLVAGAAIDVLVRRAAWHARWRRSPSDARREQRERESPEVVRRARQRAREALLGAGPREGE